MTSPEKYSLKQYLMIEQALEYIDGSHLAQPGLEDIARAVGVSAWHLQKTFSQWAGISPKRFMQFANKEFIKSRINKGVPLFEAAFDAGLSSTSRLHELFVTTEAVTPGQLKSGGNGLQISYGFHQSPFGDYLLGNTEIGVCHLAFLTGTPQAHLTILQEQWPEAKIICNQQASNNIHARIFGGIENKTTFPLLLKGSNFQIQVWQALLDIPSGDVCAYQDIAVHIHRPGATRAVASAIAANKIAYLIPCHRVIRKLGNTGQYRWGAARKKTMLTWEKIQVSSA